MSTVELKEQIETAGFAVQHAIFDGTQISSLKSALTSAIEKESEFHGTKEYSDFGRVLCCPMYDEVFLSVLEHEQFTRPFEQLLGEDCIVYVYTSSSLAPNSMNFASRLHRDSSRIIPGHLEMLGALILLDDFTEENGATRFLAESQHMQEEPEQFEASSETIIAKAGSVCYFDSKCWHAAGHNRTNQWRHALAIGMVRPYMKQRFDLPHILQTTVVSGSSKVLQKLGFYAQPPKSLSEYYERANRERKKAF